MIDLFTEGQYVCCKFLLENQKLESLAKRKIQLNNIEFVLSSAKLVNTLMTNVKINGNIV